jgi:hypothetical protein
VIIEPSFRGCVQDTVAPWSRAVATIPVGAVGTVDGMTALERVEDAPVPSALAAVTENLVNEPLASPVTTQVVPDVEQVCPLVDTTTYPVMVEPSSKGAVHDTVAWPLPGVALTPVGASGTVDGVTGFDGADVAPVPSAFDATTVKA